MKGTTMKILLSVIVIMLSFSSVQAQYYWERLNDRDYGYNPISRLAIRKVAWTGKYLIGTGWRNESKILGPGIYDTAMTQYFGYSLDSGKTWTSVEPPLYTKKVQSSTRIEQLVIIDSLHFIACGGYSNLQKNNLLRSTDGGKSWFSFVDNIDGLMYDPRISFFNSKRGIMGGSALTPKTNLNVFFHTEDGGNTWTSSTMPQYMDTTTFFYYNNPVWIDSTTIFNFNFNTYGINKTPHTSRTYISYDAGYTWEKLGWRVKGYEGDSSRVVHFFKVYFPTPNKGYAFGSIGEGEERLLTAFITDDKGLSWTIAESGPDYYPQDGRAFGEDTFIYVTGNGKVRYTFDGGTTWQYLIDENVMHYYQGNDVVDLMSCAYFFSWNNAVLFSAKPTYKGGTKVDNPPVYRLRQGTVSVAETESTVESSGSGSIYNVYPQPASQTITFDFYAVPNNSDITFKIYTMYGVEVGDYTEQLQKASSSYGWKSMKLDVSLMPTGLYIAHLEAGNRSDSFSFVVVQ